MITLRPYQKDAVQQSRDLIAQRKRRLILQAPTGSGKTVCATGIIESAVEKGRRVLFIAHRKELIEQASEKLDRFGIPHGIIMANHWRRDPAQLVQVASIQTWRSWAAQAKKQQAAQAFHGVAWRDIPWASLRKDEAQRLFCQVFDPDLIIIDEAHLSIAKSYLDLVTAHPRAAVLGLTATPVRGDGRALGDIYQDMVRVSSVSQLIEQGYLVRPRHFAPATPDLSQVGIGSNGDYDEEDLAGAMDRADLVGNLVTEWKSKAAGRPSIAFAVNRRHSRNIVESFQAAGVRALHLDGASSKQEREGGLRRLANREIDIISNVGLFTEGLDLPLVSCIILARPTRSLALYLQMSGRGLRTADGKPDCIILDHAGSTLEFGLVSDDREWSLDGRKGRARKESREQKDRICESCSHVFGKTLPACPECGWTPEPRQNFLIANESLELVEITEESRQREAQKKAQFAEQRQAQTLEELLRLATQRGYKPGWAHKVHASRMAKAQRKGWQA